MFSKFTLEGFRNMAADGTGFFMQAFRWQFISSRGTLFFVTWQEHCVEYDDPVFTYVGREGIPSWH